MVRRLSQGPAPAEYLEFSTGVFLIDSVYRDAIVLVGDLQSVDMKFPSKTESEVLIVLADHGEMIGVKIVSLSKGRIGRGGIYTILSRLEDKGLVQSRTVPPPKGSGGMPRRLYKVTKDGKKVINLLKSK